MHERSTATRSFARLRWGLLTLGFLFEELFIEFI
jgi:hypothetical protein